MLFSNKNQTSYEYYGKLLTKIKVLSKTRCILHYLNNFNMLFKYLYKQSKIFKTIYFHKKYCFSFIHILVLLRMFLPFCVYSSIFIIPFQIKFMIICSFYISTEKCVVCETESTSICFVPSFSRTLGGSHPLLFR